MTDPFIDDALRMAGRELTEENRAEVRARLDAWLTELDAHPERYVMIGWSVPKPDPCARVVWWHMRDASGSRWQCFKALVKRWWT